MTTHPTPDEPVRVEPSEEKIRAAFEASRDNILCARYNTSSPANGEYMYVGVEDEWQQYRKGYLAGWKDRGGE